jgi:predicted nucleotidyltransferase
MDDSDRQVLEIFAAHVRERFPTARVWAFGSRARGEGDWDSDFDVCVVLDEFNALADQALSEIAWEVGFAHDRVITTIPFSRHEFEHGPFSESTLVETIRREGIAA